MTAQERDYEEILGRALHSATDQIEPVGDGLTKIRARLTEPWLKRQWWLLRSELMVLRWLVVVRCEAILSTARAGAAAADSGGEAGTADHDGRNRWLSPVLAGLTAWVSSRGPGRGPAGGPPRARSPLVNWLRPALAVAGAVTLVVAGVFAMGPIQKTFVGLTAGGGSGNTPGSSRQAGGPGTTNGGPGGRLGGANGHPTTLGTPPAKRGTSSRPGSSPSPSPCAAATTPPVNSPSPSPTPTTPSPSPTQTTPSPSPTPTTPSPSPTTSGGPMVGSHGGYHSQAPIKTTALMMCEPTPEASPTNQAGTGS